MGKCRLWVNVAMGICRMGICRMGICRLTMVMWIMICIYLRGRSRLQIFYSILMCIFDKNVLMGPSLKSTIPVSKLMTIFVDGVYIFFTAISLFGIKCIFLYSLNAIFKKAWLRPKTHFGKSTSQFIRHTCYFRTWKGFNDILDVYRYVIFSPFEMSVSECFFSSSF